MKTQNKLLFRLIFSHFNINSYNLTKEEVQEIMNCAIEDNNINSLSQSNNILLYISYKASFFTNVFQLIKSKNIWIIQEILKQGNETKFTALFPFGFEAEPISPSLINSNKLEENYILEEAKKAISTLNQFDQIDHSVLDQKKEFELIKKYLQKINIDTSWINDTYSYQIQNSI